MKINLSIDEESFNIEKNKFCGIDCLLITPKLDPKWNEGNLYLRSLITDLDGNVLSSGFPKFFNNGEKPDLYPKPESFNDWTIEEKIDGSLLIADHVNDQFSMRTRGTVSYKSLLNYKDFEVLISKHPNVAKFLEENSHLTLLFEIVTPNNVIVVRPKEIEFYFLGAINKNAMQVVSKSGLEEIHSKIAPIKTPHFYDSFNEKSLSKIAEIIKPWKGKEGIVISYNNSQNRVKLKSDWYLFIHHIKSKLNSRKNLIEFYIDKQLPCCEKFLELIENEFDYEIALQLEDEIKKICEAGEKAQKFIDNILEVLHDIRSVESRKEQAEMIIRNFKDNSSLVFSILDSKKISTPQFKKLIDKYIQE